MRERSPSKHITTGSTAGNLLFSTVRIDTMGPGGGGAGTGFIFRYQPSGSSNSPQGVPLLITNRHVVEGAHVGNVTFLRAADESLSAAVAGETFTFNFTEFPKHWFYHPDPSIDLCLLPLALWLKHAQQKHGVTVFLRALTEDLIPKPDQLDAVEDVYMVGYPNGLMDDVNYIPVVRKGITATPWHADYKGRAEFVIDASVFPGSSGSPVLLIDRPWEPLNRLFFLGVLSSGYFRTTHNEIVRTAVPVGRQSVVEIQEMIDLGIAIKSTCVLDLVRAWAKGFFRETPARSQ